MGNKNSSETSSEYFIDTQNSDRNDQNTYKQQGGELDLSVLDSENMEYENYQAQQEVGTQINMQGVAGSHLSMQGGSQNFDADTENFINVLKNKINQLEQNYNSQSVQQQIQQIQQVQQQAQNSKQTNQSSQQVGQNNQSSQVGQRQRSLTETSDDYNVFDSDNGFMQQGGSQVFDTESDTGSEIDTIMQVAHNYLQQFQQNGGASDSDEEDEDDSDEDLDDDSDEELDDSSEDNKKTKRSASASKSKLMSESISSESVSSNKYSNDSSESFGQSQTETSASDTPYQTESINTSSINLVSFENPSIQTNGAKKGKKNKKY